MPSAARYCLPGAGVLPTWRAPTAGLLLPGVRLMLLPWLHCAALDV